MLHGEQAITMHRPIPNHGTMVTVPEVVGLWDKGRDAVEKAIGTAGTIEMSFLERGLIWVSSVTTIAPLVGFLGTVSGMINAFEAIAASEQVNAKLVASGISEALITTATGLIIAIPAQLAYNWYTTKITRFVRDIETATNMLLETFAEMDESGDKA